MYFKFYYFFFFLRKYIKQKNMRLLLTFIIFIFGGFYTFGKENCCEQCCEYLGNCCKKGKEEVKNGNNVEEKKEGEEDGVQEEFYLKKTKVANSKEIEKLVNTDWYNNKGKEASFIFYEKINGEENQNLNENDVIKVTKYENGFSVDKNFILEKDNNTQKWALFEIIYKKEKEEGEERKMVYLYCSDIESIKNEKKISGIFNFCTQHIYISVIACDTSGVTDMCSMFEECRSLTKLDLSKFNTDKVTDMGVMFANCKSLQTLDLSKFNTDKVTDMSYMFFGCSSLTELDLPNFNINNVIYIGCMFNYCASLQTVTFNEKLGKKIIEQLRNLGLTDEVKKEGNVITLGKKNTNLVSQ